MILSLNFKRKMTYVSDETFAVLVTAETLAISSDGAWNWLQWMLESFIIDVEAIQRTRTM